jgi:UDP-N-acetylmuramoylalanine--D-glutamate ligase
MKSMVLGLGISGRAAASFLLSRGFPVIGVDKKEGALRLVPEIQELIKRGLVLASEESSLDFIDQVILSPGIPLSHPLVVEAKKQNIEVVGEVEFAFRYIRNRCVGITGSNGKTTTTLLITHVLNSCGISARALGNVGVGLSTYLFNPNLDEILVVELSSFQLETLKSRVLDYALILNITENHLDRYDSMKEYAEAKLSIQNCLKEKGNLFVSKQVEKNFSCNGKIFDCEDSHQNLQAAFAICKEFGITEESFWEAEKTFRKPPHRIEWVAKVNGIDIYNDSKSTNVESVIYALKQFSGPLILIVGGTDKGSSYLPWIEHFQGKVKHVVAYGSAKEKIENQIGAFIPFTKLGPFADAVDMAISLGQEKDTILLSPGCSSYDQFPNFERRGEAFKELILQRKNGTKKNNLDRGAD